ncbi:MAG: hypothetical protein E3K32_05855 [wastewater metagenome]|nr:hypothetical protein [Candidatus Loosdrechtia aerotolerans]
MKIMHSICIIPLIILFSFPWPASPLYSDPSPGDVLQQIIQNSTFTRVQKPLIIRTDKETLEYFMEHVEELVKHGKDFRNKELIIEAKDNGLYFIQMPQKRITGEFYLANRQPHKVIYLGQGNANTFFDFSGSVVLEIEYRTGKDKTGPYEKVKTAVHLQFDNTFLAVLAKAASPLLTPQLDKLIARLAAKTKRIVETAYETKNIQ